MSMSMIQRYRACRNRGVPLVAIITSDPAATMRQIVQCEIKEKERLSQPGKPHDSRVVCWDVSRGLGEAAPDLCSYGIPDAIRQKYNTKDPTRGNPRAFLEVMLTDLHEHSTAVMLSADAMMGEGGAVIMQGVWNLRDAFKPTGRMLVMIFSDGSVLPTCLKHDVEVIDEPLPSDTTLGEVVDSVSRDAKKSDGTFAVESESRSLAVQRLRGMSAFAAEQALSLSCKKGGYDLDRLWERARQLIDQTRGLSVDRGSESFVDIGGQEQAKRFGTRLFGGPQPPAVVVRIEEIEKVMGGADGDMSGTSQDALQVLLNSMEDNNWAGMIAFGPPGSGKSLYSKSLANTFDRLALSFDLNATKGSLVGQSEQHIRAAVKVIKAIGGQEVFFVATANNLATIKPELKRRFRYGTWMFDIPDDAEREAIWKINRKKFKVAAGPLDVDDTDFTGADIRNACELAYKLGCTLAEAVEFTAPLCKSSPESISSAREMASGRYLSASRPGMYTKPVPGSVNGVAKRGRAMQHVED